MNKRQVGNYGEERAVWFLTRKGYQILGRNYRCRQGEVDIIAKDGSYLVFIEVKYRKSGRCGDPAEAVGGTKQKRLYQAARHYLCRHGYGEEQPCRFDVVAVYGDGQVRCMEDAFGW